MILEIGKLKEGSVVDGIAYLQSYARKSYAGGDKFFIVGSLATKDERLAFKIWDATMVDVLHTNSIVGQVVRVQGVVTVYQGVLELKVTGIATKGVEEQYPKSLFLKSVDVPTVFAEFAGFINTTMSEKAGALLTSVFSNENLYDRFKAEFAGARMHDAQIGGLMNHTMKMLNIAEVLVKNELRFQEIPEYLDLLYLGVVFHDIGKVFEMESGVYQENSFVTHRTMGVEILVKYKEAIAQMYNMTFYYQLLAILQGHHGVYGDKPTTVMSYIVHLIDMLESGVTGIFDKIETKDVTKKGGLDAVRVNDSLLVV